MYAREIVNMFLVGQVSELFVNFNNGIYSNSINMITVILCLMVLLIE